MQEMDRIGYESKGLVEVSDSVSNAPRMQQKSNSIGKIVALIPANNEEGKTVKVVEQFPQDVIDEIVVINDGSTDNTLSEVRRAGATALTHPERKGIGAAIRTGIEYALTKNYDIIVVMAGNGKDNPQEIPQLVKPLLIGDADYVQGSRYLPGGERGKMPIHRLLFTRLYSSAVHLVTGCPITDATNGFRAYKTSIFHDKRIDIWQDWLDTSLEYYLSIKVLQLGYKVQEVPVTKIYPQNVPYNAYTKIKPFTGWFKRLKPLFFLTLGIRK